jgi:CheY-like chemotaxis protein
MKRILVVDDDVQIARIVAASLSRYAVTIAHDGVEAIASAASLSNCDLVITDYLMAGMAGDEVAGRVRDLHPAVRTLLLTGYAAFIDADARVIDAQIDKPFQPAALRSVVAELIGEP